MSGSKTKLTPAIHSQIVSYIAAGAYVKHAAESAGISHHAASLWLSKGKTGEEPYAAFYRDVQAAKAKDAVRDVQIISKAGVDGDWKAAAWKLERKHPKLFGQRHQIELSVQNEQVEFLRFVESQLGTDVYVRLLTAWEERQSELAEFGSSAGAGKEPGIVVQKLLPPVDVLDTEGEPSP